MLPYLQSVTAQYSITFGIAASTFLGVIVISIQNHKQYILSTLFPAGSPVWLSPLLVPIELILYIFRPFSLSIRLFANMMAGHCLLVIVISYFTIFIHIGSPISLLASFSVAVVVLGLIILELGVSALQAYVFTLLSCSYISDAEYLH
jgi:F-type H+-transporting ATPase subunit a